MIIKQSGKFLIAAAITMAAAAPSYAASAKATLIDTFDTPVFATKSPGDNSLLFVVEQPGVIRVLLNEVTQVTPFLDLTSIVNYDGAERGLLSMAFPPDYQTSHLFYVAFTNSTGDVEIDEFKRNPSNRMRADLATRRLVFKITHRAAGNHNGGQLQFGPDKMLYISVGDGGTGGDSARNLMSPLGKILRINPKRTPSGGRYSIPGDNPFVGQQNRLREMFAYGLRNPWRFSFDGDRIIIADVGQNVWEEINFLTIANAKGANFGWNHYEGRATYDTSKQMWAPPKFPMFVYEHTNGRCAVVGGYVMHDARIPALNGRYVYGDLCDGIIMSMVPDVANQRANQVTAVGITATNLSSFGVGAQGRIYITQTSGQLSRIDPPGP